jgi:Predicted hydrolases or acyltransferases (alpha/beta hydrolase superfamily)
MEKAINYGGTNLVFADNGKGNPIVLLHGYLESQEIWYSFAEKLKKNGHRLITLDLPGHGLSGVKGDTHSMEFQAGAVLAVLNDLKIEKCVLVGHSMGGYVALTFAKNFSERLAGLCLFHSTPNPDSDEKRASREREIELVKGGKIELIAKTNISLAFARENHKKLEEQIEEATIIAMESTCSSLSSTNIKSVLPWKTSTGANPIPSINSVEIAEGRQTSIGKSSVSKSSSLLTPKRPERIE